MINVKIERSTKVNEIPFSNIMLKENAYKKGLPNAGNYFKGITQEQTSEDKMVRIKLYSDKSTFLKDLKTDGLEIDEYKSAMHICGFKFKKGSFMKFNNNEVLVGSGGVKSQSDWRQLGFDIIKYIRKTFPKCTTIRLERVVDSNSKQFFEGLFLADYNFQKYKTKKKKVRDINFLVTPLIEENKNVKLQRETFVDCIKEASRKVVGQNLTRDWVNTTPEEANSITITDYIKSRFNGKKNIEVKVYEKEDLEKLNMVGHLTVNRASKFPPRVVRITYTPKNFNEKENKVIVAVGKGLTYDSGGLSIKPGNHMTNMKCDKGGAMTLYGFADVLSRNNGKNKVVMYLAFAENMISPDSYRPDDVVIHKNGVTSHIKNTDAEGRVVMFDSLCLAQEENPKIDTIFSIATLTGAAVYQFGNEAAGMVSKNNDLFKPFEEIGEIEDEIFCEAKLHKFMLDGVNDDFADISNTGTPNQGCQKAGLYLMNAITKKNIKKYIHLDIAGPTFVEKPFGTNPSGATGFGVRTLYEVFKD